MKIGRERERAKKEHTHRGGVIDIQIHIQSQRYYETQILCKRKSERNAGKNII